LKSRLQQLDDVEREVADVLRAAATCMSEASKEKIAPKTVERFATEYLGKLKNIETSMLEQINYLNQIGAGAAHEGSVYLPLRQRRSAAERTDYFSQRLTEAMRKETQTTDDLVDSQPK